jgi:phosphatidylglycerol---prolipoprotein diacylglyceryl transferase
MHPYLLKLGPFTIASFGLMVALGFLTALYFLKRELSRQGLDPELGSSIITAGMVGGLAGAKLYYVLFETPPGMTWGETFRVVFSGAGLTWYGGFIVAAAAIVWLIRRWQAPLLRVADAAGIALAIGYAIGRIGCQLAGDGDYGVPTDLPWGMAYPDGVVPTLEKVHPTPVYETLSNLGIFALLWSTRRRLRTPGLSFCLYLVATGLARFLVEFIRLNPRVLWGLSDAQLISLGMMATGLGLGAWLLRRRPVEGAAV